MSLSDIKKSDFDYTSSKVYVYRGLDVLVDQSREQYECTVYAHLGSIDLVYTLGSIEADTITELKAEIKALVNGRTLTKIITSYENGEILDDTQKRIVDRIESEMLITVNTLKESEPQIIVKVRNALVLAKLSYFSLELSNVESIHEIKDQAKKLSSYDFNKYIRAIHSAILYVQTKGMKEYRVFNTRDTYKCNTVYHNGVRSDMGMDELILRGDVKLPSINQYQLSELQQFCKNIIL